jgi:acyl transferase domain-containing protein/NAD(P)-dependent dehydrogenase (short-subunit alcohol dehydrogenase family)/acyl carrier protein
VAILDDAERRDAVAAAMHAVSPATAVRFATADAAALAAIEREHGTPDALIDLRSLGDPGAVRQPLQIAALVGALMTTGLQWPRLILAGEYADGLERCYVDSWLGFARSLRTVLPQTRVTVVGCAKSGTSLGDWAARLVAELRTLKPESVLYEEGRRLVCSIRPTERADVATLLRRGAAYVITGGTGGLGLLVAGHLAEHYAANLLLTGRSPLDETKAAKLRDLEARGARVLYRQADVCDRAAMHVALADAEEEFGAIGGVIHAAGVESHGADPAAFRAVLAPKIDGTLALEEALGDRALDFICYFSSSSAILGDFGSCDYAIGNRFQSALATYRGQQPGARKTVAIDWPLWRDGGMGAADEASTRTYLQASGQRALETGEGLALFEQLLSEAPSQQLVMAGQPARIHRLLGVKSAAAAPIAELASVASERTPAAAGELERRTLLFLGKLLSSTLKVPLERIESDAPLEAYGIDSVMVMQLTAELEKSLGSLPKTLFFEHQTLEALAAHLVTSHRPQLTALLGLGEQPMTVTAKPPQSVTANAAVTSRRRARFASSAIKQAAQPATRRFEEIAVIGMSGRYPQAANLAAFWENLKAGKDCITEIPKERWDLNRYFDAEKGKRGKSYSKWGGFIDGVDQFDPLFFNVSPREAEGMDPQERLFLQCVYETLEDAGYTRETLARHSELGLDGNVGVFVGVMYEEYQLFGAQAQALGHPFALPGNPATIANRVSYFCNFHGPSMAVDTMCSSSLTAIHLACQSLQRGGCEVAVAGGVNVSIHPNKYLALSQGQFLSSQGRCESFGEGGDGFVAGEGVGAVLLKPLAKAIADRDQIYGVIRATAVNHGGKTNGYSVPNPAAQANVIANALRESGIPARAISYIEAHGTGTKLGDPIEIAGLSKAFAQSTSDTQFCAIGSAKSNIGHCESAAGIAGVTKVLLQLKHGTLAPSLHAETLNPHIDFLRSPFVVQQELAEWKRPTFDLDGRTQTFPRIAGISSFGAGGSNAHVVIEEYVAAAPEVPVVVTAQTPALVVLSARSEEQLTQQVRNLLAAIAERGLDDSQLADLAYTLQLGREPMEQRLALAARSMADLRDKLTRFLDGEEGIDGLHRGEARGNRGLLAAFTTDDDLQLAVRSWVEKGKHAKLLDLWVRGLSFDWRTLHAAAEPRRISLPTYPFAKERYWAVPSSDALLGATVAAGATAAAVLHPLLHENTSDLYEQRFTSTFSGKELFLADHQVQGARVLPGVCYLEMARAAVTKASGVAGAPPMVLRNIVWSRPFTVGASPAALHIALVPEESGRVAYEIYSESADAETDAIVHSQGVAELLESVEASTIDLHALRERSGTPLLADQVYAIHTALGIDYGPAHRGVQSIATGTGADGHRFALAHVTLPPSIADSRNRYLLHPTLLDSALHASIGLMLDDGSAPERPTTWLPFALEQMTILAPMPDSLQVVIRESAGNSSKLRKLDVDLCDATGNVCVQLRGFTARALEAAAPAAAVAPAPARPAVAEESAVLTFTEQWEEEPLLAGGAGGRGVILSREDCEGSQDTTTVAIASNRSGERTKTIVCVLRDEEYQRGAVEAWRRLDPAAKVIFVSVVAGDVAALSATLASIIRQHGRPDAILHLSAVEEREAVRDYDSIVTLIQAVAAADVKCPRIVLAAELATDLERCYADSWLGFPRSLRLTLPETKVSVIAVAHGGKGKAKPGAVMYQWMNRLWAELASPKAESALYESGKRFVARMQATERTGSASGFRRGGTYLLTGALGSLGSLIATHLADRYEANLILTGRRPLGDDDAVRLAPLGDRVLYIQADVCDLASMQRAVQQGRERFGSITGVIHAAGVESGQSIVSKDLSAFQRVLAPKVEGTLVLDEALQGEAIELVCYLSSSAAILGDFSYCDYAVANRFQMAFARYHRPKTINGRAGAKLVSINWPLWKEGHMMVGGEESTRLYLQTTGQRALETAEALALLDQLTAEGPAQQLVMAGTPSRIHRLLGMAPEVAAAPAPVTVAKPANAAVTVTAPGISAASPTSAGSLEAKTIHYLKQLLSASIKLPLQRIDAEAAFESYGVESVMAMQLTAEMEKALGSLPKTLFFEYLTVEALAHHLVGHYRQSLSRLLGAEATPAARVSAAVAAAAPAVAAAAPEGAVTRSRRRTRFAAVNTNAVHDTATRDIAIIGMSGRYPMARNLEAFWANLVAGIDSVTEVPAERWDHSAYFDARKGRGGKSYSKWGGFIEEIDRFDPLFFNISPREAQFMDPQERLFLESVWNLLESSGCTRDVLQQRYENKVGVYVGSMYQQLGSLASRSAVANRVSYFFGLQGPSMAIDTMCSSAAVAIHNACGDLLRGDCRLAIAGGINLTTHPVKYVSLSQGQLLGSHPGSRSFADGDGYIPAEAVGSVLLKPLAQAEADGDEILAVIKASAVNHSGRSNGYSVPNPAAQAQLIEETVRKAGVDVRTISYVEAAANGSALGDPIELAALGRVFGAPEADRPLCAIGSVKSNMGHAEAASGIAQLTKLVLQLRNGQLVPSIKAETLNPNLTFDGSNFRLQREGAVWQRPVVTVDGERRELPRRALLNSFGAGGSNACLVLEEYVSPVHGDATPATGRPEVIVLSAKNPGRLAALVSDLLDHLSARQELSLSDLAYTLQVGREAMSSRLALVAGNRRELLEALRAYVDGFENGTDIALPTPLFTGELTERSPIQLLTAGKAGEAMMQVLLDEQSLEKLALLWTQGCRVDWARLHAGEARHIVALPTYPFERDLFPLPAIENAPRPSAGELHEVIPIKSVPAPAPVLHVLRTANKVAPRNDLERSIAAVWEEALGISGLGIDDSFLDLGGNSIQGAHIVSRLRELFAIDIPIQALLGPNPTIANMAIAVVTELMRLEGEGAFDQELVESPA